jgi:serine/threonine-protein kinase
VIHRDLKPSNIRVTPDGRVKILDFGLARAQVPAAASGEADTSSWRTSTGRIMGTAHYMAPEQARGRADGRSDLFSLGVILYQLTTGRLPFLGVTNLEALYSVANEDPPPLARYAAGIPDELQRIVRKLLAKHPSERYQSAHEVRTDLERLRQGLPRAHFSRAALHPLGVAGALVALIAAGAWGWMALSPPRHVSLAVLPFDNRTGDTLLADVSEGLAADVLGHLEREGGVDVAPLAASRAAAGVGRDARSIAHELGVQRLIEGSLKYEGPVMCLDVRLLEEPRGVVRWSGHYPFYTLESALQIERDIASQVAGRMAGGHPDAVPLPGTEPSTMSAYATYLRAGPHLDDTSDPGGPARALALFDEAIARDSAYALAWTGRSRALLRLGTQDQDADTLRLALDAVEQALERSPGLLDAHVARAKALWEIDRRAESIREREIVTAAAPFWSNAWYELGFARLDSGDPVRAEASFRRATELQPDCWKNWDVLGGTRASRGEYAGARRAFGRVVRIVPKRNRGFEQIAAVAQYQGDYAAAVRAYQKLPERVVDAVLASNIGTANFYTHRLDEARRYYQLAADLAPTDYRSWANLGDLFVRAGHPDSARAAYRRGLACLEQQPDATPAGVASRLERALLLAKSGDCTAAESALRKLSASLPPSDNDCALQVARLEAVCGQRLAAIAWLQRTASLGTPARSILAQDEFAPLASEPAFQALIRAAKR